MGCMILGGFSGNLVLVLDILLLFSTLVLCLHNLVKVSKVYIGAHKAHLHTFLREWQGNDQYLKLHYFLPSL